MNATFLVDEDMPRSMASVLREAGYQADDVRDLGLRGQSDDKIFEYARNHNSALITADLGFTNPWRFPRHSHAGVILVRLPNEMSTTAMNQELLKALESLKDESFAGILMIVEVGRVRIRR